MFVIILFYFTIFIIIFKTTHRGTLSIGLQIQGGGGSKKFGKDWSKSSNWISFLILTFVLPRFI
jgi:hypothetical protein